ncbi:MAG: DUF3466 family protein [Phycisphaerales bacterium]|nr:DUF3466 family protein [Phycisphaerales bacterium]
MSSGAYLYARCVMGDRMNRASRVCGRLEVLRAAPGAVVLLVAAAAVLAGAPREAAGQCYYTYEQIPNPPGWQCVGRGINAQGWVAGYTQNFGESYRAFIWTPMTGTSVIPLPEGYYSARAFDINDSGHVVGYVERTSGGSDAFFWDGETTTVIPRPPWATHLEAYGVNNQGQVVGMIHNNSTGPRHAFLWQSGALIDLTPDIDDAIARGVNDVGVVVGTSGASTSVHAFVITSQGLQLLPQPDPLVGSEGLALNNNGVVVGLALPIAELQDPGFRKLGAVWDTAGGALVDLVQSPPESRDAIFHSVNDAGRAIGGYERRSGLFAWQAGVVQVIEPYVLPAPSPRLGIGYGINNAGQIVSTATGGSVVLTPIQPIGDLSGDCRVSIVDLVVLLRDFGAPVGTFPAGDVDLDGDVDLGDLALLLSNFGT